MITRQIPQQRQPLGFFPTPLVSLNNLSKRLHGPRMLMKRDDQTGLASGGNKTRKLEFLFGEALAMGCDTVITGGAAQSNHCRQTVAAAASCGLQCHLVLGGEPARTAPKGNLLLDDLLGAHIHWTGKYRKGEKIPEIFLNLKEQGCRPYVIPYGGSNATGALGFVDAVAELTEQIKSMSISIDTIVFASSSGGTQAGLMVGRHMVGADFELIGIAIDKGETGEKSFAEHIAAIANDTADLLELETSFSPADIQLYEDYVGKGYGVVGKLEKKAIRIVAETEGILLDPVYTGRAMGGLLDLIDQGKFSPKDTVLFWHTGGLPALFSYAKDLQ
ncbi:MAG: D-cysteine desulfhydrase family protein [Desulfobulbus sp.]|nr:MAG: D-cysteine desulfhydrase family protein [Desulfobulbus sp.]